MVEGERAETKLTHSQTIELSATGRKRKPASEQSRCALIEQQHLPLVSRKNEHGVEPSHHGDSTVTQLKARCLRFLWWGMVQVTEGCRDIQVELVGL